jgi:AcrR family transcriptional regulator
MTGAAAKVRATHDEAAPLSHRERKKARTRTALIEVSQQLFAEKGYGGTTLEEICEEVDIRPQTLLRYFESKAALALAPVADPMAELQRFLEDPNRAVDTLTVWREYMKLETQEVVAPTSDALISYVHNLRDFRRWADRDPVLVAMFSDIERRLRDVLASSLAHDRAAEPDDLHSTLVAALLVAGRTAVYERWLDRTPDAASLIDDQLAVIDYAVKSLPRRSARRLLSVATS